MAFTDSLLQSILQKAIEIEKWAILERETKPLGMELNFYDILDELRYDGQGDYAKELEKTRDELLREAEEPPTFTSGQTAFGLFKKLRRIIEDRTDDSKKLLLYADSIEDLVSDKETLYSAIWNKQFEKLLNIVVSHIQGYDLFGELLGRVKEKKPTAATQLKEKYDKLIILSNVENACEDELKAIESAALDLVSRMREIAEQIKPQEKDEQGNIDTIQEVRPAKEPSKEAQQAYQLYFGSGFTQNVVAEKMTKIFKRPISQGQVSKWIKQYKKWRKAEGISIDESKPNIITKSDILNMGARTDGKMTGDPRHKKNIDYDDNEFNE